MRILATLLFLIVIVAGLVYMFAAFSSMHGQRIKELKIRCERQSLALNQVRQIAWSHRDISPELSTILVDELAKWQIEIEK